MSSQLFHLNELAAAAAENDFQHRVEQRLEQHGSEADFPQLADYDLTREQLGGYLFDRQAILDSGGSPRMRYTICGFLVLLPIIILSGVPEQLRPWGEWSLLFAIAVGLVLFAFYLCVVKVRALVRRRQLDTEEPHCAAYVKAVEDFHHC